MKTILAATDFSTRSDRALRRAAMLARGAGARLVLAHAVDSDRPPALVESERRAASDLLGDLALTLRTSDGVAAEAQVVLGDPFEGILEASAAEGADLVVVGAHRRQILRDIFVGTTVERIIRRSRCPVLMVNAMPARPYRQGLIATDLSAGAAAALEAARRLELVPAEATTVLHFYDDAIIGAGRTFAAAKRFEARAAEERPRAQAALARFLGEHGAGAGRTILRPLEGPMAQAICDAAREIDADLIAVGTRGQGGLTKVLTGSVTLDLLRIAERDVLAVPLPDAPNGA